MRYSHGTYNLAILAVDVPTRTGLVYKMDAVNEIIKQAVVLCRDGRLLGWPVWLGPQEDKERKPWVSDPGNASHLVRSVWTSKSKNDLLVLHASIEPLETENGRILKTMLKTGEVGLGMRVQGKLEHGSTIVVSSCLSVLAIDALLGA